MKKGDRAKIYHDPLTKSCTEGSAELIKFYKESGFCKGEKYEMWEVRFYGDDHTVVRKFSEKDIY